MAHYWLSTFLRRMQVITCARSAMTWEPISARACTSPLKVRPCQVQHVECMCVQMCVYEWNNEWWLWCKLLIDICIASKCLVCVIFVVCATLSMEYVCVRVWAWGSSALLTAVCTVLCSLVNCLFVEQAKTYIPSIKPTTQHLCPLWHEEKTKPTEQCHSYSRYVTFLFV